MDWIQLLSAWGPAAPLLYILLKAHNDVVYTVFPKAVEDIMKAIKAGNDKAERRHRDHLMWQKRLFELLAHHEIKTHPQKKAAPARKRKRRK